MRRPLIAAALAATLLGATTAHAADVLETFSYVVPTGLSTLAIAVNGTFLAYDQPAPQPWRIFGWATGAADIVAGTVVIATGSRDSETIVVGGLALALGAAAITTAFMVTEDRPLAIIPVVEPNGAALVIAGRF